MGNNEDAYPPKQNYVVAERLLLARIRNSAEHRSLRATIGAPFWTVEGVEAACPITIEGLYERLPDVRGIDPIDALRNAITLVESLIDDAQKTYALFWSDGEPFEQRG